jgi:hypothetical protein
MKYSKPVLRELRIERANLHSRFTVAIGTTIVDRPPDRSVRARLRIRLLLRIVDAQSGRLHHLSGRYDERQAGSDHRIGAFARAARSPNGGRSVCPRRSLHCALARRRLGCYARISAVAYPPTYSRCCATISWWNSGVVRSWANSLSSMRSRRSLKPASMALRR